MSTKDEDIKDVMREERSRGRKPVDIGAEREKKERDAAILKILERRDRKALEEALSLYYGPDEVKEKLKLYDSILGPG